MDLRPTALERAFELASTGTHLEVSELRRQLSLEGLDYHQITGPSLVRQLKQVMREANAALLAKSDAGILLNRRDQ